MVYISLFLIFQISSNITVIPDSSKKPVSPLVFGSGDEMNASFSPLSQIEPLIIATKPSLLRFGGIGAEYFDWEGDSLNGITYIDFVDTFTIPVSVNFGVDSLLRVCESSGAEPILTVNMQVVDTSLARRMVEYVNGDTTTPMGKLRKLRGHPEPYNVKIWSLGNEPDIAGNTWGTPYGVWTFYRHFNIPFSSWSWRDSSFWTPQDFANLIPMYVQAMQNASPIPLSFIFSIAGVPSWVRPVVEPNINLIDYLDVHYYPSIFGDSIVDTADYIDWLSKTDTISSAEEYMKLFRDTLDAIGAYNIDIVVLEFNAGIIINADAFWWNYLTGLFIADCIGHWMNAGLKMAAVYSIHEGKPGDSEFPLFGIIRGDVPSRRMPSYVLELYNTYFGDTLIYAQSDHRNKGYGIECWASKRSWDNSYSLVIINKTLDTSYYVTLKIKDSIETFHLLNITNNAPIDAPYNGTTGIEDRGFFYPDSIKNGFTFVNLLIEPKSVNLIEATPFVKISERSRKQDNFLFLPTFLRKSDMAKFLLEKKVSVYSLSGRKIDFFNGNHSGRVKSGIYIIRMEKEKGFRKIIIMRNF